MKRAQLGTIICILALSFVLGISSHSSEAANPNVGYVHPVPFGSAPGSDPTADKPQSKLWYTTQGNITTWWAVMFNGSAGQWRIHKLTWPNQWVDTGVRVDDRATSRADALWDAGSSKLYIVSLVRLTSSNQSRLYRYTFGGGTYTLDAGYPVVALKSDSTSPSNTGSAETTAFDKDTTGRLWITFTQGKKVWVNSNPDDGKDWGKPFILPNSGTIGSDDISSLVAYNDRDGPSIGVLWSNHTSTSAPASMNFSYHKDGDPVSTWQPIETIYGGTGTCLADDHINIKSVQSEPSGTIFAAVKTSVGDSSSCTGGTDLIRLVVRNPTNDTWKWAAFGGKADNHTRPIVLLDTSNRKVYMFATSPTSCGIIYMKTSPMDNPSFSAGKGTAFISSSSNTCINNATSTKQTVNSNTGLVVMASDENSLNYLHNIEEISAPSGTPTNTPTKTNTPTATSTPTNTPTTDPNATPTPTNTPTPASSWSSQNIGTATGGSFSTSGSSLSVSGSGSDIWSGADSFRYAYQPASGDIVLTGKLTAWAGGGNAWAKGGLMLRASTAPGAVNCFIDVTGSNGLRMQWRTTTGGSSTNTASGIAFTAPSPSAPLWLRLSLSGSSCTGEYSTNGGSWTTVASTSALSGLGSSYLYGIAVTAHDTSKLASITFDALDTGGASAPTDTPTSTATPTDLPTNTPTNTPTTDPNATPTPASSWSSQNIGTATGGSFSTSGSSLSVSGSGSDVWSGADSFRYAYQPFNGDIVLTGKLTAWAGGGNSWAKGGLMLRASTAANAANCFIDVTGSNGLRMQWRAASGSGSSITSSGIAFTAPSPSAPLWLRLSLSGSSCSAFYSTDGSSWNAVGTPQTITGMGSSPLYGIAVTAHDTSKLASATFDGITVTP